MKSTGTIWMFAVALLLIFLPFAAGCQAPGISLVLHSSGFSFPVHITHAGDGSGRLFVVEQGGRIRIVRGGILQNVPFLDISNRVLSGGERGLLSVAFPPDYLQKGHFYVNYTRIPDGATVVARYFIAGNPDVADSASEQVILTIPQPFANHNGGQLAFGPDGFLYIAMGDGGSGGDPMGNGQNPMALLGKMLRIDVESGVEPYALPESNPFVTLPGILPEIWALGLRNPWRFSFDRLTGDLYIGDVGQNLLEEIDFQPASSPGGENYGWDIMEGSNCFNEANFSVPLPGCNNADLTLPVAEYGRASGCSVTGGMVYRGTRFPSIAGTYFYGDFCTGRIWGLEFDGAVWQNTLLLDSLLSISTFGEDEAGELYLADHATGNLHQIVAQN